MEYCPVGLVYRIHPLASLQRGRPTPNVCPRYDTKQSDGEDLVMLKLW